MMRRTRKWIAVVAALGVIGLSLAGVTPASADDPTFTISGTIQDSSGNSIQFATVEAYGTDATTPVATTTSNYGGTFDLPGLPAGDYRLKTSLDKYQSNWYNGASDYASASPITVADQDVPGIAITLQQQTYTVEGTVSGETAANVLEGQGVELYDGDNSVVATTTTDKNGHFEFDGLKNFSDLSLHYVGGDGWAQQWFHNEYEEETATKFQLDDGSDLDVILARVATVSGRVTEAGSPNHPVADADVIIEDPEGGYIGDSFTDAKGDYAVTTIPSGSFKVFVNGPDIDQLGSQSAWDPTWYGGASRIGEGTIIKVPVGGGRTGINIGLVKDTKVTGTLTDRSTGDALPTDEVDLVTSSGKVFATSFTDEDGHYQFDTVPSGAYQVHALQAERQSDFKALVSEWWGGSRRSTATIIHVAQGHGASHLNISLPLSGFVGGTVESPFAFDPEATVELLTTSGTVIQKGGIVGGTWGFNAVPGTYVVRFITTDGYYASSYYPGKSSRATATRLKVVTGERNERDPIEFDQAPLGAIHGVVKSGDGSSITGLTVTPSRYPTTYYNEAVPQPTTVKANGSFTIPDVPAGKYTLTFGDDVTLQPALYANRFDSEGNSIVTVKNGHTTNLATTQTVYPTVNVTGTVTAGGDLASSHVEFFNSAGKLAAVADTTNDDGSYDVNVRPGKYRIRFGADVSPESDGNDNGSHYGAVWYGNVPSEGASKVFDTATSLEADAEYTHDSGSTVTGIAIDAKTKRPVDALTVILWRELPDGTWYQRDGGDTNTDGTGRYTIPDLGYGTYRISFSDDPFNQFETSWDGTSHTRSGAKNIVVKKEGSTVEAPPAEMLRR